jgi:PBP1b-binding outer membrane lipoprotein LpoB
MNASNKLYAAFGAAALVLAGCSGEPTQTQTNFGVSVRQMIQAQIADPSTLGDTSSEPIDGSDGRRTEAVLEAYRTDVAKPETVNDDVVISLDNAR